MRISMRPENIVPARLSRRNEGVGMTQFRPTAMKTFALLTLAVMLGLSPGCNRSEQTTAGPKTFATQEEASKAVYDAAKAGNNNTLLTDRKSTRLNSSHRCISYA